jgi:cell division protein FtsQ
VSLQLDDRGAWEMQLTSGIRVRLGARMVETRLDRFFEALDKVVAAQAEDVDYIDMRYTNGFAIGWKNRAPMNAKSRDGVKPHV